jgi:hypothetical protein
VWRLDPRRQREEVTVVEVSHHAEARMQQRGITRSALSSLLDYGATAHDHRGSTIIYFDKKARTRLLLASGRAAYQRLEKQLDTYAVVACDGAVVTVGHRNRRIPRP